MDPLICTFTARPPSRRHICHDGFGGSQRMARHSTALKRAHPKCCSHAGLTSELLFTFSSTFPIAKVNTLLQSPHFILGYVKTGHHTTVNHTETATWMHLWPLKEGQKRLCYITPSPCCSPAHSSPQPPSTPAALQRSQMH